MPIGLLSFAPVAGFPSPPKPDMVAVPATTYILLATRLPAVAAGTSQTTPLVESEKNTLPLESTAIPCTKPSAVPTAGVLCVVKPQCGVISEGLLTLLIVG